MVAKRSAATMIAPAKHGTVLRTKWRDLSELSPASFAMIMATGILSIGLHQRDLDSPARALFGLNLLAWAVLWVLTVLRLLRHTRRFANDLIDHLRGPGFFTTVAATAVLGCQLVLLTGSFRYAMVLWAMSIVLWVGLTYTIFTAFTIKEDKPTLDRGITGGWLLAVVATQSLAVLSALVATHFEQPWKLELNFFALSMWLWGGMLYIWMMSLIFYRYTFFHLLTDLAPPYWINMGAMAITLAGLLVPAATHPCTLPQFAAAVLEGIHGVLLGHRNLVDTHAAGIGGVALCVQALPLHYDPLYSGPCLPGMYAVSTDDVAGTGLSFRRLAPLFLGIALLAWSAAFLGLLSAPPVAPAARRATAGTAMSARVGWGAGDDHMRAHPLFRAAGSLERQPQGQARGTVSKSSGPAASRQRAAPSRSATRSERRGLEERVGTVRLSASAPLSRRRRSGIPSRPVVVAASRGASAGDRLACGSLAWTRKCRSVHRRGDRRISARTPVPSW